MPVIIGQLGHDGDKEGIYPRDAQGQFTAQAVIRKAQWDLAHQEDKISGVTCVRTASFWDMEADGIYYGPGGWQKMWNFVASLVTIGRSIISAVPGFLPTLAPLSGEPCWAPFQRDFQVDFELDLSASQHAFSS